MRVAVLGAGGTIAPAIVWDLAESEEVESLLLLDLDLDRARAVAHEHGAGKAEAREADARRDLAAQLEDVEVLVNSAAYRINLDAMRACLEAGSHYIDLGGLYHVAGEQLELSEEFEGAGLLALLGMGSSPGKTNVMAVRAMRELGVAMDDSPHTDYVHVAAGGRDLNPSDGLSFPYALRTLLDEVTMAPVAIVDHEPVELAPLQAGPLTDFGDPIGGAETIYTLHSEMRTFGDSFGCHDGSFRLSLPPKVLEALRELVGADEQRIEEVARSASPPSPETVSVHVIEAGAGGRAVRVRSVTAPSEAAGLGGGIISTASPAAAAVRLLADGRIEARGALPPERCVDPDDLFPQLESRGVHFEVTDETGEGAEQWWR
jgi:saccharopine dehydrogenase-like NADP-dependent oxidoreductase